MNKTKIADVLGEHQYKVATIAEPGRCRAGDWQAEPSVAIRADNQHRLHVAEVLEQVGATTTRHQFGTMVDVEKIGDVGQGFFDLMDAVLLKETSTIAVAASRESIPTDLVALMMVGRVNKSQDSVQVVWVMEPDDAGMVAVALKNACRRIGVDAYRRFANVLLGTKIEGFASDADETETQS